jgi:UDP-N-acetylmuramoyl-L-alanyl-D-glutamate--2,6-diaminopimelate ligase
MTTTARTVAEICAPLSGLTVDRGGARAVSRVVEDSRLADADTLFVAVKGTCADGHDYLPRAFAAGCRAVVVERPWQPDADAPDDLTVVSARSTRGVPSRLARELADRPDLSLTAAGVTGTNGKTTTTFLLRTMLEALVGRCGLLGTILYDDGRERRPASLTTPSGPTLFPWLRGFADAGGRAVALEVSSHALAQERVVDLALDVAVLTNLGRDHLDYHGSEAAYLAAKARILELLADAPHRGDKPSGVAVVNVADPALITLRDTAPATVNYDPTGTAREPADVRLTAASTTARGSRLEVDVRGSPLELRSDLVGRFNVENLVAALAAGVALGLDGAACADALAAAEPVPGRLERFALPARATAIVDYAHTPDALAAALAACRELTAGRLLLVFGCGGDRDRGKRPAMGRIAAKAADRVWITNDNPRGEDPAAIADEIAAGLDAASAPPHEILLERRAAIRAALRAARPGEVVLIAGKGHEDYQIVGDRRLHLDDREIVRDWVEQQEASDER